MRGTAKERETPLHLCKTSPEKPTKSSSSHLFLSMKWYRFRFFHFSRRIVAVSTSVHLRARGMVFSLAWLGGEPWLFLGNRIRGVNCREQSVPGSRSLRHHRGG